MRPNEADEMHFDELRRAVAAASRDALPSVVAMIWRAYGNDLITEDQAGELSGLVEDRKVRPAAPPARRGGSRPRSPASMERRRRWAASGALPVSLACRFTLAEQAVLAVVAAAVVDGGDCRMTVGEVAGRAGVSESSVRNAIREARAQGLVHVQERRVDRYRNDTNVITIVSVEWRQWLVRGGRQGGCKSVWGTDYQFYQEAKRPIETALRATGNGAGGGRRRQDGSPVARTGPGRPSRGSTVR